MSPSVGVESDKKMDLKDLYPGIEAASQAISPFCNPAIEEKCHELGLSWQEIFILIAVPTFEPDPVSVKLLNIRSPYTSPFHYQNILVNLSEKGMLKQASDTGYRLTDLGLQVIKEFFLTLYTTLSGIQPLPVTQMMDLASRLKDLADACLEAPDPPGTWCIRHARRLDPGNRAPMMARIDQFFDELRAYRDDAHLAAWRGYEENGHAWDILTYLWAEPDATPETLNQALSRRGNSMEETLTAVEELIIKGWVSRESDRLCMTPFGREIRKTAEDTTNRYYLMPFHEFTETELERTLELINDYRQGIPYLSEPH